MRMATFIVGAHDPAVECSLIAFPGDVGGVRANLERWLGQLGLPTDAATLDAAEAGLKPVQVAGEWPTLFVDFREISKTAGSDQSLLGAIINLGDRTLFVKMSSSVDVLQAEEAAFRALITSLRKGDDS